ncbi:hypothetical protein [Caballeronia pedi]|uniref:hypothetical protein n=1 Tax=Caballeronia pedi TaxID=1777141 RepID=UPI00142DC693|nr:hypothetical protein [Caballeronia pedi]
MNPPIPSSARTTVGKRSVRRCRRERGGTIEQREHGNIDVSLVPKGKEHPDDGPYAP